MRSFKIVYLDHDQKRFGISETMFSDTETINRTCEMQKKGQNVSIFSIDPDKSIIPIRGFTFDPNLKW
ncbi:hypothetical protein [Anaerospora hongkongensis]|uniref:hypothetical protein n=1 Tax=Anaerospora hongkongensis TaxID=244830 RepID=UPI002896B4C7|nr:hypothetical protein [Anaerospora hongkongensis]